MSKSYAIKGTEIPEENRMFVEIWEFRKKYYKAENTETYMNTVKTDATQIYKKYPTQLCHDLLWAVIDDCERRAKTG